MDREGGAWWQGLANDLEPRLVARLLAVPAGLALLLTLGAWLIDAPGLAAALGK